jgi:hypothetical protein
MESLLVEEEVLSHQTRTTIEKGHNFWFDHWIALKILHEFPDTVCLVIPMESLLIQEEFLSRQTRITAEKDHNFLFDRWIVLKGLQ